MQLTTGFSQNIWWVSQFPALTAWIVVTCNALVLGWFVLCSALKPSWRSRVVPSGWYPASLPVWARQGIDSETRQARKQWVVSSADVVTKYFLINIKIIFTVEIFFLLHLLTVVYKNSDSSKTNLVMDWGAMYICDSIACK